MPATTPAPVALVTGAGSGIGRAVAERLAREGWRLALVGRTETRLRETEALLAPRPGRSTVVLAADMAEPEQARAVVHATLDAFGQLDALVNNAGAAKVVPIEETTEALLHSLFAVNVFGPTCAIAAAWPAFRRQGRGTVVNVSSYASIDPFPGFTAYGAAKSALDSVTRSAAKEGAAIGVRAYSVNPGAVETAMLRSAFSTDVLPASRTLHPDAVADVVWGCVAGDRVPDNGRTIAVRMEG